MSAASLRVETTWQDQPLARSGKSSRSIWTASERYDHALTVRSRRLDELASQGVDPLTPAFAWN